ncbi:MAG: LPS export ABC transporter permease LptF [Thermoanaerobaculia bacterium]
MRGPLRLIDRYLVREILGPFSLGLLIYTFILLIHFLFQSAELIIRRGLPAATVGKLFLFYMPSVLVLTVPMALLFGILVAIGRLSAESELTALRACGISLSSLYRPVLTFSLALTLVTGFLSVYVLPRGNNALQELRFEIVMQTVSQHVESRVFVEQWPPYVLYVFDNDPVSKRWRGVFVADGAEGQEHQVTIAESGTLLLGEDGERLVLELDSAYTHKIEFERPDRYNLSFSGSTRQLLQDRFLSDQQSKVSATKGVRSMTLSELEERIHDPDTPLQIHNAARVEVHKKFAFPVACLVFGLLALPLGITRRRGGRSSGFALSVAVILLYYVMLSAGEEGAIAGRVAPWLAMWAPNIVLTAIGLALLVWRNRERGIGITGLWSRLSRRPKPIEAKGPRRRPVPKLVLRVPRPRIRFPNLMDRYVMRRFAGVFVIAVLSTMVLYVVGDLTESARHLFASDAGLGVILNYYKYFSLQIFFDIAPIAVLVATLVTFSLLSRTNEVTASKALGVSVYRLALPALMAVSLVAIVCVALQLWVLPAANRKVGELSDAIRGRTSAARTYLRADRQWVFGRGRHIYNYQYFQPPRGDQPAELTRLQVFEFDTDYRLTRRVFAQTARYTDDGWVLSDGWLRRFSGKAVVDFRPFSNPIRADLPETPDYFMTEVRPPEQMGYRELRRYVRDLRHSGQPVPELEVSLRQKIAFPLVTLVMAFVALPFAFRLGRRGALYGLGLAVVLSIVFYAVYAFFGTLGETGALPPAVAVWSPNTIFALLSAYLFLGVRT